MAAATGDSVAGGRRPGVGCILMRAVEGLIGTERVVIPIRQKSLRQTWSEHRANTKSKPVANPMRSKHEKAGIRGLTERVNKTTP